MTSIAVVVPVFNEVDSLPRLIGEITDVLDRTRLDWEIVVVDDGSTDDSAGVAVLHGAEVIRSELNRGKSAALQAGFDYTLDADIVVTMDGDLQDVPTEIPRLIDQLAEHDMAIGWKEHRKDSRVRRMSSRVFAKLVRLLSGVEFRDINSGFKAYRRRVLDSIFLRGDYHRLIPLLALHAGFTVTEVSVTHRPREHGRSRYGWQRIFRGPIDLASAAFLIRFGGSPLRAFGLIGGVITVLGLAITLYLTILKLFYDQPLSDRPLLLLGVLLLVVGVQIVGAGFIGEMVAGTSKPPLHSPYRNLDEEKALQLEYAVNRLAAVDEGEGRQVRST